MDGHEWRGVKQIIGYFADTMDPLHLAWPLGMAKGAKECPIALEIIAIAESNAVPINQAEPVNLPTLVQMLRQLEPLLVAWYDLHDTHIDVQPSR